MSSDRRSFTCQPPAGYGGVVRAVTALMSAVVGLTFLFGFGNVLSLALRLGVPAWVAPLVAPAVDLSILGLLLAVRHLALAGASPEVLRPARRLLVFASAVTLALNVAEPLASGQFGKGAFDSVGPLLLIGWAEVGPGLLLAIGNQLTYRTPVREADQSDLAVRSDYYEDVVAGATAQLDQDFVQPSAEQTVRSRMSDVLLTQARKEDAAHRAMHQKPISADTLRIQLRVGAARSRQLVKIVRSEFEERMAARQRDEAAMNETPSLPT
ncbi:hypothetical protein [Amycolatopsis sp. La24]|uniref:hypothetical protein n=1 Tax=Amycolatopsis sp. La24 TaxID=3028304 RepID=UPI0023AF8B87|nr:hypothetical protein [Amycolatopsis sp. La24]